MMELKNALNQLQVSYSELQQFRCQLEENPEMYDENGTESNLENMEGIIRKMPGCIDSIRDSFE